MQVISNKRVNMTEKTQNNDTQTQQNPNLPPTIHAQYIKDMSFENPNAPDSLKPGKNTSAPSREVNGNMDSQPLKDKGFFEVVMTVNTVAKRGDETLFIAELVYGVVCSVSSAVPE